MSEIDKLRALEREATPGPWTAEVDSLLRDSGGDHLLCPSGTAVFHYNDDACLVAALRNCAPELLALAEAAEAMGLAVSPYCKDPTCSACRLARATDALRAAIRRATEEDR